MITQNNGSMTALEAGLEAVLFAAGDAVTIERLSAALEAAPAELLDAAAALENRYDFENRGIMLLRIEDKLQLASRPMYGPYVRRVTESRRPPAPKPNDTLETGITVVPSAATIGLPIMVLTSTISLILDMVSVIKSLIG